jgi:hypothetical protein
VCCLAVSDTSCTKKSSKMIGYCCFCGNARVGRKIKKAWVPFVVYTFKGMKQLICDNCRKTRSKVKIKNEGLPHSSGKISEFLLKDFLLLIIFLKKNSSARVG